MAAWRAPTELLHVPPLASRIRRGPFAPQWPQSGGTARVVARGSKRGAAATVVAESLIGPNAELGTGGGGTDTAVPPSVVAQMIARGETLGGPGMWIPEHAVDPDLFFGRLAERGVTYSVTEERGRRP